MRIIAGNLGRRNIKTLAGLETRPTSEKNRGAIFNALGQFFDGGKVLDLFSGSGAMALEAISRGMEHATCVDTSKDAIAVIKHNALAMGVEEKVTVVSESAFSFLKRTTGVYDLIVLDPPYDHRSLEKIIAKILERDLLSSDGRIAVEYRTNAQLHEQIIAMPVEVTYEKVAKTATIQILRKK